MLEIDYPEVSGWYPFFDELKEIGMNTVVIAGIGGFPKDEETAPPFSGHIFNIGAIT